MNAIRNQMEQTRDEKGRITGGKPPKGFNTKPENINRSGHWKKEDTPRFKLEQMMKLKDDDLLKVIEDAEAPRFEKKLAQCLLDGEWREIKEMIQEVYGKPQENVTLSNPDGSMQPVVRIIDERKPSDDIKE